MSEFAQECVGRVQAAGGTLEYKALYEQTPAENRQLLPNALKEAMQANALSRKLEFEPGQGIKFTYSTVTV